MPSGRQTIKLTKKALADLPYGLGWVNVDDSQIARLRVNSGAKKKAIYIRRRVKRGDIHFKVCDWEPGLSPEQIRKHALKVASQVIAGVDPNKMKKAAKPDGVLLGDAFDRYISTRTKGHKAIKKSTAEQYRFSYKTDLEPWAARPLNKITGDDVEKLHMERSKTSPSRANVATRLLGRIFRFAMEVYRDEHGMPILTYNPADRVSTLKLHNKIPKRSGHIPKDKLKDWFESVNAIDPRGGNDAARDLLIFTLMTGLRRNEAARLEWGRVDLDEKSFSILENKAGRPFKLPLSDYLYQMLARRKKTAGRRSYVFPAGNKAGYLTDWRHWTRQIGGEMGLSFTPHDLRRTFATVAESLDISPYTIKALVNHSLPSDDVTGGYIQIDVERLRGPMQRITDYLLSVGGIRE